MLNDDVSGPWEVAFSQGWGGNYTDIDVVRSVKRFRPRRLVEVGCGKGANFLVYVNDGMHITGVDYSKTSIAMAQEKLNSLHYVNAKLIVADLIKAPPTLDEPVDMVVDVECLYTLPFEAAVGVADWIYSVLKPGGVFFSKHFMDGCYGQADSEKVGPREYHSKQPGFVGITRYATEADMRELFRKFEIIEMNQTTRSVDGWNSGMNISEWLVFGKKAE